MNWFVFAFVSWVGFGIERSLLVYFDAGQGGVIPSVILPLIVFLALHAPKTQTLWAAIFLGITADLLAPMVHVDGGASTVLGPHALSYLLVCQFIFAIRGMVIRKNPLTLVALTLIASLIAQIVLVAIFTIRGFGDDPIVFRAGAELFQRSLSAVYTGLGAIVLSFIFFALEPAFGFHSAVPTRFARHL
ncbi:MAG: rod shape-determining protein MreD [Phycisphaerales bacterium]|nr:rod shape-determining protein MreD [Phycisphaerales bacterium]